MPRRGGPNEVGMGPEVSLKPSAVESTPEKTPGKMTYERGGKERCGRTGKEVVVTVKEKGLLLTESGGLLYLSAEGGTRAGRLGAWWGEKGGFGGGTMPLDQPHLGMTRWETGGEELHKRFWNGFFPCGGGRCW